MQDGSTGRGFTSSGSGWRNPLPDSMTFPRCLPELISVPWDMLGSYHEQSSSKSTAGRVHRDLRTVISLVTSSYTVKNYGVASPSKFLNLLFNDQGQTGCWYWTLGAGVSAAHVGAPPLAWEGSVWADDWPPPFNPTSGGGALMAAEWKALQLESFSERTEQLPNRYRTLSSPQIYYNTEGGAVSAKRFNGQQLKSFKISQVVAYKLDKSKIGWKR